MDQYSEKYLQDETILGEKLENRIASLLSMLGNNLIQVYNGKNKIEGFGPNTVTEINFSTTYQEIEGTAWNLATIETAETIAGGEIYCYTPVFHDQVDLTKTYYKRQNGAWVIADTNNTNFDDEIYVFEANTIEDLRDIKKNEKIISNLYHDYDQIRIAVALPIYRYAYSAYVALGLPGRTADSGNPNEQAVELFYNTAVEFIDLLETYEKMFGYEYTPQERAQIATEPTGKLGLAFTELESKLIEYMNSSFTKSILVKTNQTAVEYNEARDSIEDMKIEIERLKKVLEKYDTWIEKIASGKYILNDDGTGLIVADNPDRRMYGYKYVKVGTDIIISSSKNKYGYLTVSANGKTFDVAPSGFEPSTDSKLITNIGLEVNGDIYGQKVYNAVFNDYAEYRKTIDLTPGHCVIDNNDGSLSMTMQRLQPGTQVISDTFGSCMGKTNECETPLAVAGRVLVYTYQPRENYQAGMAVCSAPNGTVDIMTREEIQQYPDCIVGIVSEIPDYDTWGTDNVKIDGRIWIKVR